MVEAPIKIRQLDMSDLPELLPLVDSYRQEFGYEAQSGQRETNFLKQLLGEKGGGVFFGAFGDRLLAFSLLIPHQNLMGATRQVLLNDLFVSADARRRGVGKRLVTAALEYTENAGCGGLVWTTEPGNHSAQYLYGSFPEVRFGTFLIYRLAT